jgi:hypothetical protein
MEAFDKIAALASALSTSCARRRLTNDPAPNPLHPNLLWVSKISPASKRRAKKCHFLELLDESRQTNEHILPFFAPQFFVAPKSEKISNSKAERSRNSTFDRIPSHILVQNGVDHHE